MRIRKTVDLTAKDEAEERWYTTGEAAALLGMTTDSVRRAIRRGAIKAVKYGQWRIPRRSLEWFWALEGNDPGTLPADFEESTDT